jgi:hypothetical protein
MNCRAVSLTGVVLTAVVLSCGTNKTLITYEGPRRSSDGVAIITVSDHAVITRVDDIGKKHIGISADSIEVLPGLHTIEVNYRSWKGGSDQPLTLAFEAEAGRVYRVDAEAGYHQWTAKVVDLRTGRAVSR